MLNALRRSCINADVWRPMQLRDGTVEAELDMLAPERPKVFRLRCEECHQPFTGTLSSRRFSGKPDAACPPGQEVKAGSRRSCLT